MNPIHLNPAHKGDFTAFAKRMGMTVQQCAAYVLNHKDKFSPERVKQANFARNARLFNHPKADQESIMEDRSENGEE